MNQGSNRIKCPEYRIQIFDFFRVYEFLSAIFLVMFKDTRFKKTFFK